MKRDGGFGRAGGGAEAGGFVYGAGWGAWPEVYGPVPGGIWGHF